MIRVRRPREPRRFDELCRKRGNSWLEKNPGYENHPRDYWSKFEPQLRRAFKGLCAYCAMRVAVKGEVDHFVPISILKSEGHHYLAYEWSNLRYSDGTLNQKKCDARILDPFEVRDDWFCMLLPSLQLVLTDKIPDDIRPLAEFTLERLGLRDHEALIRYRKEWFDLYRDGHLNLEGLRKNAPMIARAVESDLNAGKDWRRASKLGPPGSRGSAVPGPKSGDRKGSRPGGKG